MKTGHSIVPMELYVEMLVDTAGKKDRKNQDSHVFLENERYNLELPQEQRSPATFME